MNDDDLELASAYLDDEVTADERARVEASAELRQLVDELRAARDAVADVDAPPAAARDEAIAAALAVFDEQQVPAPPANVVPIERAGRWRWRHGLGVAAAAVAVVVAGVAVLRDDAEAPTDLQSASDRAAVTSSLAAAVPELDPRDADQTSPAEQAGQADETDEAEQATMAASAADSAGAAPAPVEPAAPGAAAVGEAPPTTAARLPEVTTTAELAALAERLTDDRGVPLPDRRDARERCRDDEDLATPTLVADALFIDEDGVVYSIVVVDDNGEAAGLDLDSCDLVVRAQG